VTINDPFRIMADLSFQEDNDEKDVRGTFDPGPGVSDQTQFLSITLL
jgi:hypothetical protein